MGAKCKKLWRIYIPEISWTTLTKENYSTNVPTDLLKFQKANINHKDFMTKTLSDKWVECFAGKPTSRHNVNPGKGLFTNPGDTIFIPTSYFTDTLYELTHSGYPAYI